eukprot:1636184-Karenia_brevis.AAC.1
MLTPTALVVGLRRPIGPLWQGQGQKTLRSMPAAPERAARPKLALNMAPMKTMKKVDGSGQPDLSPSILTMATMKTMTSLKMAAPFQIAGEHS